MEVIFIKDLKNQGKKGEIKKVKDGYGENFLIKNGYAVIKNKDNLSKLEKENKAKAKEEQEKRKQAEKEKQELDSITLEFKVKTGESDRVFGSISIKQIKDALSEKGYKIEKSQIEITNAISSLGFHNIKINLYKNIYATIKVHVIK